MRRLLMAAVAGLALALPAAMTAVPAQAAAMRAAVPPPPCTEGVDYAMSNSDYTITINIYANSCDEWIRARIVCIASQPGPYYYYYGGWKNDSTGAQSIASVPDETCPTFANQEAQLYKAGFEYSKTGQNDVTCWEPGRAGSGSCSS